MTRIRFFESSCKLNDKLTLFSPHLTAAATAAWFTLTLLTNGFENQIQSTMFSTRASWIKRLAQKVWVLRRQILRHTSRQGALSVETVRQAGCHFGDNAYIQIGTSKPLAQHTEPHIKNQNRLCLQTVTIYLIAKKCVVHYLLLPITKVNIKVPTEGKKTACLKNSHSHWDKVRKN